MDQASIASIDLPTLMSVTAKPDAPDISVGRPENQGAIGIYGGHFVGQALAAGFETITGDKLAQSLHCYFLKGGNPQEPIEYQVEKHRDGIASSTRSITGFQAGTKVFHMIAAFKLQEDGKSHQKTGPRCDASDLRSFYASEIHSWKRTRTTVLDEIHSQRCHLCTVCYYFSIRWVSHV